MIAVSRSKLFSETAAKEKIRSRNQPNKIIKNTKNQKQNFYSSFNSCKILEEMKDGFTTQPTCEPRIEEHGEVFELEFHAGMGDVSYGHFARGYVQFRAWLPFPRLRGSFLVHEQLPCIRVFVYRQLVYEKESFVIFSRRFMKCRNATILVTVLVDAFQ